MADFESLLNRWQKAGVLDAEAAGRIRAWEGEQQRPAGLRWQGMVALILGAILLATGVVLFGLIATRLSLKTLTLITLLSAGLMVIWFGRGSADLSALALVVAVTGIFTNGGIAGYYMLFAKIFPTHVRATGTGFAIGAGRGGAALAPILAGYLFQAGFGLQAVSVMMAAGSLFSAAALLMLKVREGE